MAIQVLMPKLGLTATEGTIVQWLKAEGETVNQGEPLVEVMTDKVTFIVDSPATGVLVKTTLQNGELAPMAATIGFIGFSSGVVEDEALSSPKAIVDKNQKTPHESETAAGTNLSDHRIFASPAAKRIARDLNVDVSKVTGSGPNGRIVVKDVEKVAEELTSRQEPKVTPLAKRVALEHSLSLDGINGSGYRNKIVRDDVVRQTELATTQAALKYELKPFSGMRKTIAERMSASAHTTAAVTLSTEVDMEKVVAFRKELLPAVESKIGLRFTFSDILVKVVALALATNPKLNASVADDGIRVNQSINVGLAVALPDGLVVPVVKNTDRKSLAQITLETKDLVARAREGRLSLDEMSGGVFTISNLGSYGIDVFTPIINLPEAAILGVGRIRDKVVPINGSIVIRPMMHLSLVFDHRVVDGAQAAEFLQEICAILGQPYSIMI